MPNTDNGVTNSSTADLTRSADAWVIAAKSGNKDAFGKLADLYYGDIFRMIYYRTQNRMDAEDLTQEVFLKAFRGLDNLTTANKFKGWLFRVAVNRVHDFHRRKKMMNLFKTNKRDAIDTPANATQGAANDPLETLLQKRFQQETRLFLSRLSKMEREVFLLRFFDHLRIPEIAAVLKKSESTVKTFLYRALAKFKKDEAFQEFLKG
jgi:RNA polymerase sigma-70 factor (ECF subfamily)